MVVYHIYFNQLFVSRDEYIVKDNSTRSYIATYEGPQLSRVAFPLGGIGAGMLCLEGSGAFSHVSVRNTPDVFNEPMIFAAVKVKRHDKTARLLEGPVPKWKIFGKPDTGNGAGGHTYGFPRFDHSRFKTGFPFAAIELADQEIPLKCNITAWSPFLPGNADDSSLPMAVLEYEFDNQTQESLESVFSFHAANFMSTDAAGDCVEKSEQGFILSQTGSDESPSDEGAFAVTFLDRDASVDCAWFRGGWFDARTVLWKHIDRGHVISNPPLTDGDPSPGGSIYLPFTLQPGEKRTITILLTWHVPKSKLREGIENKTCCGDSECTEQMDTHVPWYTKPFATIESVTAYARSNLERLREQTVNFHDCFFDTTLPQEIIEAVAANLSILKSPTVLRQTDGRLWCWEGCCDGSGCCSGSCTHVWNYAQAVPHLFPDLERSLRQTEFNESQNAEGHQKFRSALPIREIANHDFHSAADGQLGGIMKAFREWRILGDNDWLKKYWPKITASLDYCINTWDPNGEGVLREPHHNTYDIEFWGPNGMCTSFYLGALKAASLMATELGEDSSRYDQLYHLGRTFMETELYNGEYFIQQIQWQGLRAGSPMENASWTNNYSPEAMKLLKNEGPKYQYGSGCLSDGVLGAWIAAVCGIGDILDPVKIKSHLLAVYRHNLKRDLTDHVNPQRPSYAVGKEGGLLLCTWPNGNEPTLPFVYSNEVWTGIEYQVASHLAMMGCVEEGLEIVRVARARYDGCVRNPFNEYECGHWYARALASYGLLQSLTGIRYDAVEKILYIEPSIQGDFHSFISTATGYATAGVANGEPFYKVKHGTIKIAKIVYHPSI